MSSPNDPNSLLWLISLILICMFALGYWIPTIIAFARGHIDRWWILIFNFVLGFTFVGWIVGILWALNKIGRSK
jgi:hypothetical protein